MKIVTIGASPYQLTARGVLNSIILKKLYINDTPVASLVHSHDINYFVPEENNGKKNYYYKFDYKNQQHKIPIFPYRANSDNEVVDIYEFLNLLQPDLVIAIGDITDFLSIKAIQMFSSSKYKWLMIYTAYKTPINKEIGSLFDEMDGIMCTSLCSYKIAHSFFHKDLIKWYYVGDDNKVSKAEKSKDKFRIISCSKNVQTSNLPAVVEAVSNLHSQIPEIELYLHTNIYDESDCDLDVIKDRFDPKGAFMRFPDQYLSFFEGYSSDQFANQLSQSDVFIDISMESATAQNLFCAVRSGCIPVVLNYGIYKELIKNNDFLVDCTKVMAPGETYLYISNIKDLENKILYIYKNIKKEGHKKGFSELILKYNQDVFVDKMFNMIKKTERSSKTLCLE